MGFDEFEGFIFVGVKCMGRTGRQGGDRPGELSIHPPLGVDPVGQMWLRIQNKQTKWQ